jgi:hypothetical protein
MFISLDGNEEALGGIYMEDQLLKLFLVKHSHCTNMINQNHESFFFNVGIKLEGIKPIKPFEFGKGSWGFPYL